MHGRVEVLVYLLGVAALGLFVGMWPVSSPIGFLAVVAYLVALRLTGVFVRRLAAKRRERS